MQLALRPLLSVHPVSHVQPFLGLPERERDYNSRMMPTPAQNSAPGKKNQHSVHRCPNCSKVYKSKGSLQRHQNLECHKKPQYKCVHYGCTYEAYQKSNYERHLKNRHEPKIPAENVGQYIKNKHEPKIPVENVGQHIQNKYEPKIPDENVGQFLDLSMKPFQQMNGFNTVPKHQNNF